MPRFIVALLTALLALALTGVGRAGREAPGEAHRCARPRGVRRRVGLEQCDRAARGPRLSRTRAGQPVARCRCRLGLLAQLPRHRARPDRPRRSLLRRLRAYERRNRQRECQGAGLRRSLRPRSRRQRQLTGRPRQRRHARCPRRAHHPAVRGRRWHSEPWRPTSLWSRSGRSSPPTCRARQARTMALSQRPAALQTLGEPSGEPAWRTIPSWYLVAGRDNAIGTDTERAMAARLHPRKTVEIKGASHVVMISRPEATTNLVLDAARSVT